VLVGCVIWASVGSGPVVYAETGTAGREVLQRLLDAALTQRATRTRLRVLDGASTCAQARFVAYRRSDREPDLVDEWYVASQLWADARLPVLPTMHSLPGAPALFVPTGPPSLSEATEARCNLDKGFGFLDRLWDAATGGYVPRSNVTASEVERHVRYADDNSLTGLALLAAAQTASAPALRQRYLSAARRTAAFLRESGLWDEVFGGGFWWNTNKGDTAEGKPAQTNALAALFFARLYQATGLALEREWALRTLHWLDTVLYNPTWQLYRWSAHYEEPEGRSGARVLSDRYFNYDQGIAVEAQLLMARLGGDRSGWQRARTVGQALATAFWNQERGGYNLEAGIDQVYTSYAAWTSLGHLALYESDGDPRWLDLARVNADALTAALREPDGSYAYRYYRCMDRSAPGCESGQVSWARDESRDTAAQAWMQHLQTAIARHYLSPTAVPGR
jgi:uncharacterized protein YyaL (SSP411 family)